MPEKIVVFGTGATGRGHVGLLAWQAGFEVVFVDKNPDLVRLLGRTGEYRVKLYGEKYQEVSVCGFRVYHSEAREAIAREIVDAALVLTAVFDVNLPDVARTLARAVGACRQAGRTAPLNCIACENMMDSSSVLGKHVKALLTGEDLAYCDRTIGFPDCMTNRVVSRPEPDPLIVTAEYYNEWTVRADAFKGQPPAGLTAMELVTNQTARLERKLFIHNGGHAVCGYLGFHRHHRYIHDAIADPIVAGYVFGALDELGEVVRRRHRYDAAAIDAYKKDFSLRWTIPEMKDEVLRVVRDPIRKLSPRERLVAPAMQATEMGLPRTWIVKGIVAALKYHHPSDEQSVRLHERLKNKGLRAVLEEICRIDRQSLLVDEIEHAWNEWQL